jgi:hypothetical protein
LPEEVASRVDEYRDEQNITESEALRQLVAESVALDDRTRLRYRALRATSIFIATVLYFAVGVGHGLPTAAGALTGGILSGIGLARLLSD